MQMVDLCRQNNSQIILWSGCPRATSSANSASYYSNSDDDLRKNLALSLGGIGIPVCDIAAAMSDTNALGTASKWSSGAATSDGLHPSDAGYVTMASTALSTMHQFSP
jgi:lysophospholipase L1-like esterase